MSSAQRVLHVIPSISPKRGGPSTAIIPMVRALNESGAKAEIVTTNDDGPGLREVELGRLMEVQGVPVRFFPRFSPRLRAAREFAYAHGFRDWLRRSLPNYDCIHVHALFSFVSTSAMNLARSAGIPYVARPLGQLGIWPLRQSAWRKKWYLQAFEAANLQGADAVHFTSEVERDEAAQLGLRLRGVVIPHGVDLPMPIHHAKTRLRARLGCPTTQKVVLFLGRLHPKKGLDLLLAALANEAEIRLILAGQGETNLERELDSMIRQFGMDTRVIRLGQVDGPEKQLLLQGADLLALISRHENFGMAVVESLAAGTPVLVSNQVALASDVDKFHLGGVVNLDIQAVRVALRRMLDSAAEQDSSRLRDFVAASYSWKTSAVRLGELYSSIARASPVRR